MLLVVIIDIITETSSSDSCKEFLCGYDVQQHAVYVSVFVRVVGGIVVLNSVEKIMARKFANCILETINSDVYLNIISYCELSLSFLVCLKNVWILPEIVSLPSTFCDFPTSCLSYCTIIYNIKL